MSYDVSIGDFDANYTYNVSKIFHDHIGDYGGGGGGLHELHGKTGREAHYVLSRAFDRIAATKRAMWASNDVGEKKFCAKYDSPNGWGSTVGAIIFLAQIMAACAENPDDIVSVS